MWLDRSEQPSRAVAYICGLIIGAMCGVVYMLGKRQDLIDKMMEDVNLRTDLINWMTTVGIYLEEEDFYKQFKERSAFINIVSDGP